MIITVGSQNPIKVRAAEKAFLKVFGDCRVNGFDVNSGVSCMPQSMREAIKGAKNRAFFAMKKGDSDFGVGMEGYLQEINGSFFLGSLTVAIDKKGVFGVGNGGGLLMPRKIIEEVKKGRELGDIMDDLLEIENTKQHSGTTGFFTKNIISREKSFESATIYALARFVRRDLY